MALGRDDRGRNYPPLLGAALVMVLLLAALPSALNLPQTNPAETLEYAPVPPEAGDEPNVSGNLAALSLGSSATLGGTPASEAGEAASTATRSAAGKSPATKRCVGNPPRQTEDAASPPCVAFFTGDNGGATYAGVSGNEVRALIYRDGGYLRTTSRGSETSPVGRCFDLGLPPQEDEDVQVRLDRALQRYFNDRYQTYGRFVRFTSCFSGSARTAEGRRADAVDHLARFKPFSFSNLSESSNRDQYSDVMLRRRVLGFSAIPFLPSFTFRRHAPLYWGFMASLEEYAAQFSAYVCSKVVPYPVSNSGQAADQGGPRRLGLLRTDNPGYPGLQELARLVRDKVTACGGEFVSEATYPTVFAIDIQTDRPGYGQENMVRFQQDGVTSVIWPGGWETEHTRAAAGLNYRPEWIVLGDYQVEGYDVGQLQEQSVWQHAVVMTSVTRQERFEENPCYLAALEADPDFPRQDATYGCPLGQVYESLRQLFTGIQVAGPRLTPTTMERGYRAIPAVRSDDPRVPACFYDPGEFTCVKDAQAVWWDPVGTARNSTRGCWRMMEGGRRHLRTGWPAGDLLAQRNRTADVCNGYAASGLGG